METSDYMALQHQLEQLILEYDPLQLLMRLAWLTNFESPEGAEQTLQLRELPILHFVTALCLKRNSIEFSDRTPTNGELLELIDVAENCIIGYITDLIGVDVSLADDPNVGRAAFSARVAKINGDVNPNIYRFQALYLRQGLLDPFSQLFLNVVGFSPEQAWHFSKLIGANYARKANESPTKSADELNQDISDNSVVMPAIFDYPELLRDVFLFSDEEFYSNEENSNQENFGHFLRNLSCQFGEEPPTYNSPISSSIIASKPVIKVGDRYFVPAFSSLLPNLVPIFEKLFNEFGQNNQKIRQDYQENKAAFTAHSTAEFFRKIFPAQNMFENLYYDFDNERNEADIVIYLDDKILIVEVKSGAFTPPARRGAPDRLKTDLRKLLGDAYVQGQRTLNYLSSAPEVNFRNRHGKEMLRLHHRENSTEVFLINVTFENLMNLAPFPSHFAGLDIFPDNVRLWSVNFLELEMITQYLLYPLSIHSLRKESN